MLNLNEYLPESEKIKMGDTEIEVTAQIPAKLLLGFQDEYNLIAEKEIKDISAKELKTMYESLLGLLKEMFYLKNDKENV